MPKLAANLTMLYNEVDFSTASQAAAKSGFNGVEYLFPYAYPKEQLAERLLRHRLDPGAAQSAGGRLGGRRTRHRLSSRPRRRIPGRRRRRRSTTRQRWAARRSTVWPASRRKGVDPQKVRATFVDNLSFAADQLGAAGIRLLIEPINTYDIPGFYLSRTQQALDVIRDAGSTNLYLQYDIYHMQRMEGELANTIKANTAADRARSARRQPGAQRAGHRRNQLSLSVRLSRRDRLRRLDRLRIQTEDNDRRRARLARGARASKLRLGQQVCSVH